MKIYTSSVGGEKVGKVLELGMGILIPSSPTRMPSKPVDGIQYALDNGAFSCWNKGYPFMEKFFLKTLEKCYVLNIPLEFIVCPDLIGQGANSWRFSEEWRTKKLCGAPNLALAVQDGMTPKMLRKEAGYNGYDYIFVGGTVKWKWDNVRDWVEFAHAYDLKCHVGRVGSTAKLDLCESIGVDSVDSSSFARNDSWDKVSKHLKPEESLLC